MKKYFNCLSVVKNKYVKVATVGFTFYRVMNEYSFILTTNKQTSKCLVRYVHGENTVMQICMFSQYFCDNKSTKKLNWKCC